MIKDSSLKAPKGRDLAKVLQPTGVPWPEDGSEEESATTQTQARTPPMSGNVFSQSSQEPFSALRAERDDKGGRRENLRPLTESRAAEGRTGNGRGAAPLTLSPAHTTLGRARRHDPFETPARRWRVGGVKPPSEKSLLAIACVHHSAPASWPRSGAGKRAGRAVSRQC